jgi:nucleotide-binding universal stress UspA family protein
VKKFTRMVVPVDGSAAASRGILFAVELAKSEGAAVEVCSVIDEMALLMPMADGAIVDPMPMVEAAAAKSVAEAVALLQEAGIAAAGTIRRGKPASEINAFARQQRAEVIIMGTTGRAGIDRLFMGSVTMDLLRAADVPVVTVHADDTLVRGPMLVAVDTSAASIGALECAIDRARAGGVTLQLVHVFEEGRVERAATTLGLRTRGALRQAFTDAEDALDDAADRVRAAGVSCVTELVRGVAVESILAAAERHAAGSIAIGTHGRGALEGFVLGSVADGVIRASRLPVYVVHRRTSKSNTRGTSKHESASQAAAIH